MNARSIDDYWDLFETYSAKDLTDALHWTSKADLKQCISNPSDEDRLWTKLSIADRGIQEFTAAELVRIIELHQKQKR